MRSRGLFERGWARKFEHHQKQWTRTVIDHGVLSAASRRNIKIEYRETGQRRPRTHGLILVPAARGADLIRTRPARDFKNGGHDWPLETSRSLAKARWLDEAAVNTDKSIGDLAHRCVGLHRLHHCRHHVSSCDGVVSKCTQGTANGLIIALGTDFSYRVDLLIGPDFIIGMQLDIGLFFITFDVTVDADLAERARLCVLLPLIGVFGNFRLDQSIAYRLYDSADGIDPVHCFDNLVFHLIGEGLNVI